MWYFDIFSVTTFLPSNSNLNPQILIEKWFWQMILYFEMVRVGSYILHCAHRFLVAYGLQAVHLKFANLHCMTFLQASTRLLAINSMRRRHWILKPFKETSFVIPLCGGQSFTVAWVDELLGIPPGSAERRCQCLHGGMIWMVSRARECFWRQGMVAGDRNG